MEEDYLQIYYSTYSGEKNLGRTKSASFLLTHRIPRGESLEVEVTIVYSDLLCMTRGMGSTIPCGNFSCRKSGPATYSESLGGSLALCNCK